MNPVEPVSKQDKVAVPSQTLGEKLQASKVTRKRIPMSIPRPKLWTPEVPGYHLHWFNDREGRIEQALQGGYEFVKPEEIDLMNHNLGDPRMAHGNTDLGTRVSISVGGDGDGHGMRAYLMKIPLEWFEEDQKILQERNEQIAETIRQGNKLKTAADDPKDQGLTYGKGRFVQPRVRS